MEVFCTYFDSNYISRFLPMYWSLCRSTSGRISIHALCLDKVSENALLMLELPDVEATSLQELEEWDERLLVAKGNRSRFEYYFTLTAAFPLYIMGRSDLSIERITYLDSDLFFFSNIDPIYRELGDSSIAIIPHRFPERLADLSTRGRYNVGFEVFRNDSSGNRCLREWFCRCLEWCYDRIEDGKYADQGYLDSWPERYDGVHVVQHKGANVAPWNLEQYAVRSTRGGVMVDGEELLFYHFAGFRFLYRNVVDPGLRSRGYRFSPTVCRHVFCPYVAEVLRAMRVLSRLGGARALHGGRRAFVAPCLCTSGHGREGHAGAGRKRVLSTGRFPARVDEDVWEVAGPNIGGSDVLLMGEGWAVRAQGTRRSRGSWPNCDVGRLVGWTTGRPMCAEASVLPGPSEPAIRQYSRCLRENGLPFDLLTRTMESREIKLAERQARARAAHPPVTRLRSLLSPGTRLRQLLEVFRLRPAGFGR
jgi:hypothetical protein